MISYFDICPFTFNHKVISRTHILIFLNQNFILQFTFYHSEFWLCISGWVDDSTPSGANNIQTWMGRFNPLSCYNAIQVKFTFNWPFWGKYPGNTLQRDNWCCTKYRKYLYICIRTNVTFAFSFHVMFHARDEYWEGSIQFNWKRSQLSFSPIQLGHFALRSLFSYKWASCIKHITKTVLNWLEHRVSSKNFRYLWWFWKEKVPVYERMCFVSRQKE